MIKVLSQFEVEPSQNCLHMHPRDNISFDVFLRHLKDPRVHGGGLIQTGYSETTEPNFTGIRSKFESLRYQLYWCIRYPYAAYQNLSKTLPIRFVISLVPHSLHPVCFPLSRIVLISPLNPSYKIIFPFNE